MWLWAFSIGGLLLASCSTAKTATPTTTGTDPVTLPRSSTSLSTTTTSTTLPAPTTTVPPGVVGYQVVQASKAFLLTGPNGGSDSLSVPCLGGKKVLGGGATITLTPPLTSSTVWLVPFLDQSAPRQMGRVGLNDGRLLTDRRSRSTDGGLAGHRDLRRCAVGRHQSSTQVAFGG